MIKKNIKSVFVSKRPDKIIQAGKFTFYYVLIGLIAGTGSVIFHYLCVYGSHFFMDFIAGYRPPAALGEAHFLKPTTTVLNKWVLLFLPAIGGVVSGWLVYTFAPEAEGHGTDAAIDSYHRKNGFIRGRVPFIKTIASAITLTTGGSGGREGPIAQIGAGFGSFLATKLKLSDRERRIMLAVGVGAGVGSIFRAPLAGALFSAEVLYRDPEFESEVIIPSGIASVVAYCVFCMFFGWGSLFKSPDFIFENPIELGPYIVLTFILVGAGFLYVKSFYGITGFFKEMNIGNHYKPAIGGLITGCIGYFLPQTLAFGYGYAQQAIFLELSISFLILLAFGKILTTSFSIGSGGSGGVFGPSIVIGGALGGVVGKLFHMLSPALISSPGSFVIVGMAGFFSAVSNTPVSTIIFVSEMTNSYHLLLPSLLVCSLAHMMSKKWSIFGCQVKNKISSPAHRGEFMVDVLQAIKIKDLIHLIKKVEVIPENMLLSDFKKIFSETKQHYFPVKDKNNRLIGVFSSTDIRSVLFSDDVDNLIVMKDIIQNKMIFATLSENLNTALIKFTQKNIDSLPIVKDDDYGILIGMLNRRELISFYNQQIKANSS